MKWRLSSRLILGVVLIEALMLGILVWNSVRLVTESHAESLEGNIQRENLLLANSLSQGLAYRDRALLLDVLSRLRDDRHFSYIRVYDRGGTPMASLNGDRSGAPFRPDHGYRDALRDGIYDTEYSITLAGQVLGRMQVGYSIVAIQALVDETRRQNTAIAIFALILTVAFTVMLGLFLTRGLRRLEEGAMAVLHDDLAHRIKIERHDEISQVALAFNRMADHVEATQQALRKEHDALVRQRNHLENLVNGIDAVLLEANPGECNFTYVSREAEDLLGFPLQDWLEPGFFQRQVHPDDLHDLMKKIRRHLDTLASFTADFRMLHRSGDVIWVRSINTYERRDDGEIHCLSLMLDISVQKASEERIVYLAEHDALTGLINRRRFQEELEKHIAYCERYGPQGALLFIDLDQFKYINDTYGHQTGDEYLVQVAHRLKNILRRTDILGRLGGDEFGVILPHVDHQEAEQTTRALLDSLARDELVYDGHVSHVSASIGVHVFDAGAATPSELLARADTAMYMAKEAGRNRYHVFDANDHNIQRMQAKVHWEERIRQAVEQDRFVLHFQPVVALEQRSISHYEVLLRMRDEEGGLIPPGAFIDTAERFGLIRDIDLWVMRHSFLAQARSLQAGQPVHLAINLSGRNFGDRHFLETLTRALETSDANPRHLIFEVTETAAVENLDQARYFIEALRELGCRIALDDFGIGFSSFHYLKHLPVDYVKIDGSFVRNLHHDRTDQVFITAIVEIARGLGITTVAEFVESKVICDILGELGVDMGQGYFLGRPQEDYISHEELLGNLEATDPVA